MNDHILFYDNDDWRIALVSEPLKDDILTVSPLSSSKSKLPFNKLRLIDIDKKNNKAGLAWDTKIIPGRKSLNKLPDIVF